MRLGDLDALIENHFSDEHKIALSYANKVWMRKIISEAPTIDAVEVVRCKDCKFQGDEDDCPLLSLSAYTEPDDFCSYGEKRGEG